MQESSDKIKMPNKSMESRLSDTDTDGCRTNPVLSWSWWMNDADGRLPTPLFFLGMRFLLIKILFLLYSALNSNINDNK